MLATFPDDYPGVLPTGSAARPRAATRCVNATQPAPTADRSALESHTTGASIVRRPVSERNRPTTTEKVRLVRYTRAATLQWPYLRLHQFVYRHSGGAHRFADRRRPETCS